MQRVTIRQTLEYTFDLEDVGADDALDVGNMILAQGRIPLENYEMLEAEVTTEERSNVIAFPK